MSQALSIGDIVLESKLGEPLLAQVVLMVGSNEVVENKCLSLLKPDPAEDDIRDYLTQARLAVKTEGARQYVVITTSRGFTEPFAKLRLQIKCPDASMGTIVKTMTILPDLDESIFQSLAISSELGEIPASTSARPPAAIPGRAGDTDQNSTAGKSRSGRSSAARRGGRSRATGENSNQPPTPTSSVRKQRNQGSSFQLKLSGEPIDESRIAKTTPAERDQLRARQKLLDADDQTANFLALQNQVKLLQDELGTIRLQLGQLGVVPSSATAAATTEAAAQSSAVVAPVVAAQKPENQDDRTLQWILIGGGLAAAILALVFGLRYYTGMRSQQSAKPALKRPGGAKPAAPVAPPRPFRKTSPPMGLNLKTPGNIAPVAETVPDTETAQRLPPQNDTEELTEEDSILDEAELYAEHGHPDKAIKILQEEIAQNPGHVEAWLLLLSVLSSLGLTTEFEQAARRFLELNPNNDSWKKIQALGRTLDQHNTLYDNQDNPGTSAALTDISTRKARPIGDVLVTMGALSVEEMHQCLADFDSKLHGRFGGYLIARKMITLAQLNEALLLQQAEVAPTDGGVAPTDAEPLSATAPDLEFEFDSPGNKIQPLEVDFESAAGAQHQELELPAAQDNGDLSAPSAGSSIELIPEINKPRKKSVLE
ncbi:MAG: tetratricopeptide repeat protein [Pseudomonadota bacterium]